MNKLRTAAVLSLLGVFVAIGLISAATLPTAGPTHRNMGQNELLGHAADYWQRMVTGEGVATVPDAPPVHRNMGVPELLGHIADKAQELAETGSAVNGDWKENARVATTATINIATALNDGDEIDGVTLADGDRVLVPAQLAVPQVETATAAGAVTGNGNASVVITSAVVAGSPLTVPVAVTNGDSAATWAGKVRTALGATAAVTDDFSVGGSSTAIVLTRLAAALNDTTLNISLATGTATGITAAPTSANTTAGSLPAENGIWIVGDTPERSQDANTWDENTGFKIGVDLGTSNGGRQFRSQAVAGGTLETTPITFEEIGALATADTTAISGAEEFIDQLRGGLRSPNLFSLANGINEFSLQFDGSTYYLAYYDGTHSNLRSSTTLAGLSSATDVVPVEGTDFKYPIIYPHNGIWHLWGYNQATTFQQHYTSNAFSGPYTLQGNVVDSGDTPFENFGGGAVTRLSDGRWVWANEDVNLGSNGRRACVFTADSPYGPWTNAGYVFGTGNDTPYSLTTQNNDPELVEWMGRLYIVLAGWDAFTQRVFIAEINPATFAAIGPVVCLSHPAEAMFTENKSFSPCWEWREKRLYFSANNDYGSGGWAYIQLGSPPADARRAKSVALPNFKTGVDDASGIPFDVHGAAVKSNGALVNSSATGGAYGALPLAALSDFTIIVEFVANAMPATDTSALLQRIGINADSNHEIGLFLKNTAGTTKLYSEVHGAASTDATWTTTITAGKHYTAVLQKASGALVGLLDGVSDYTGTNSGSTIQMDIWQIANFHAKDTEGNQTIAAANNFDGTILRYEVHAEALPLTGISARSAIGTGPLRTVYVRANEMTGRTTAGAAAASFETSTNDIMVPVLDFDQTTEEGAGFWRTLPPAWNAGTITAKFHWTAASGTGTVKWDIAARGFTDDDALDQALGTEQTATADTLIAAGDTHISATTPAITVAGSVIANRPIYFQVTRDTGGDTLDADARLIGVTLEYMERPAETSAQ